MTFEFQIEKTPIGIHPCDVLNCDRKKEVKKKKAENVERRICRHFSQSDEQGTADREVRMGRILHLRSHARGKTI